MLGDQMRYWRFKNLNSILAKAEQITQARGQRTEELDELPFGDALRTVETASYEEEESVQDLWARLIANAVDPTSHIAMKKVYLDLLRSISPAEAAFLDLLWVCEKKNRFTNREELVAFNQDMNALAETRWRRFEIEDRRAAIQNLVRIRCVVFRPRPVDMTRLFGQLPREAQSAFGKWSVVDPEKFQKVINDIGELVLVAAGVKEYRNTGAIPLSGGISMLGTFGTGAKVEVPEMNFMLTALGTDLMRACEEESAGPNHSDDESAE